MKDHNLVHQVWQPMHVCSESDSTHSIPLTPVAYLAKDSQAWLDQKLVVETILKMMDK